MQVAPDPIGPLALTAPCGPSDASIPFGSINYYDFVAYFDAVADSDSGITAPADFDGNGVV
ncbi:MAG: hypothetical protein AAF747_04250, partial [Planctomycetota bacterium]